MTNQRRSEERPLEPPTQCKFCARGTADRRACIYIDAMHHCLTCHESPNDDREADVHEMEHPNHVLARYCLTHTKIEVVDVSGLLRTPSLADSLKATQAADVETGRQL